MALTTYTELKASVADWLNRSDLTAAIPDFITLAEARLARHPAVQYEKRGTITVDAEVETLPSDCLEVRSLAFDDTVRHRPIEIVSPELLPAWRATLGETGAPSVAAVTSNGTELQLSPTPDTAYVLKIVYLTAFTPLSSTVATNWVLTSHPDLYLFGSLVEAAPYLKDDERIAVWQSKVEQGLAELQALVERRRYGANTLVMRPKRPIG